MFCTGVTTARGVLRPAADPCRLGGKPNGAVEYTDGVFLTSANGADTPHAKLLVKTNDPSKTVDVRVRNAGGVQSLGLYVDGHLRQRDTSRPWTFGDDDFREGLHLPA